MSSLNLLNIYISYKYIYCISNKIKNKKQKGKREKVMENPFLEIYVFIYLLIAVRDSFLLVKSLFRKNRLCSFVIRKKKKIMLFCTTINI
jgi:hypothetical protein